MKYYLILIEKLKYTVIFNLIFEKSFTFIYFISDLSKSFLNASIIVKIILAIYN